MWQARDYVSLQNYNTVYFKSTFLYIWNVIYFDFLHHTWPRCAVVESRLLRSNFNDDFTKYEICEENVLER
jgi:hypothetical protein